jgi:hypothetical protein
MSLDTARTSACATVLRGVWHDGVVKRTTVFLPDELYERLRGEALACRVSMAELIRRRLRRSDPLARIEGIVRNGRLSRRVDEALYPH